MRRFSLAAVGKTCAVIAIEYGGIAHGFGLVEHHLTAGSWTSIRPIAVLEEPTSVHDLLTARGYQE
jgi:hypothetical protein